MAEAESEMNVNDNYDLTNEQEAKGNAQTKEGENEPMETDDKKSGQKGKKSRVMSEIWKYFTRIPDGDPDHPRAKCNYCGTTYAAHSKNSGTSSMKNHLDKLCPKNPNRVTQQKLLCYEPKKEGGVDPKLVAVGYDKEACRKSVAKYLVLEELSFRHVESEGFRQLVNQLEPRFDPISRMTVARDIYQLYLDEKMKLKDVLKKERVSLTTDTWTSIQNINYMCITAHWIDSAWKLQKRIINFCQVTSHKGKAIGQEIEACLNDWGIRKLFAITVDNASANNVAIDYIKRKYTPKKESLILNGDYLHMRCSAHIINIIVTEGMKEKDYSISSIRNAIRYVRSSSSRLLKFKECVKDEMIECKGLLCLDVATRWNSTFLMLSCAIKFQKAFERMDETDADYRDYFMEVDKDDQKKRDGPPCDEDWDNAKVVVQFLHTFFEITVKFSGSSYVTANMYFPEVCEIQNELLSLTVYGDPESLVARMAVSMQRKFKKYWGDPRDTNEVVIVANILDPRYKFQFVTECFESFYDVSTSEKLVKHVEDTLRRLFDHYNMIHFGVTKNMGAVVGCSSGATSPISTKKGKLMSKFERKRCEVDGGKLKNEVDKYLSEEAEALHEGESFDILLWWNANSSKYKVLSLIARDILAIPVTSVPSESAFSTGGRILDPFRSSLSPKTVEGLVCLKNWLSSSNQSIIVKEYMDEAETLDLSVQIESDSTSTRMGPPTPHDPSATSMQV